jgi:hypothetical protein
VNYIRYVFSEALTLDQFLESIADFYLECDLNTWRVEVGPSDDSYQKRDDQMQIVILGQIIKLIDHLQNFF